MYILSDVCRSITDLGFMIMSIGMAHTIYKSRRRIWQIILAWGLCVAFCGCFAVYLGESLNLLQYMVHERISVFVGFSGILVYLYLFSDIPIAQRLFTYFFIDNIIYLIVILARTLSVFLTPGRPQGAGVLFIGLFGLFAVSFSIFFAFQLKRPVLRALRVFRGQLPVLTLFALINYASAIAVFDPWEPMNPADFWTLLAAVLYCGMTAIGYYIAFRTLIIIKEGAESKERAARQCDMAQLQLTLTEARYSSMMESQNHLRQLRHDMYHHLTSLSLLAKQGEMVEITDYLAELVGDVESVSLASYCRSHIANISMGWYENEAEGCGIRFTYNVEIPEEKGSCSADLCAVLCNALQNAVEACERMESGDKWIAVTAEPVGNMLMLSVENSFDGIFLKERDMAVSRKGGEGHGIGLRSIRGIAARRNGYCKIEYDAVRFSLAVVLQDIFA